MDDLDLDAIDDGYNGGEAATADLSLEDAASAVAEAFRLKDREGLTLALRVLVRVVDAIEQGDGAG